MLNNLNKCPFCGAFPERSGDYCISCNCGASIEYYNPKKGGGDRDHVISMWNNRPTDLEDIIIKASKISGNTSAYTDLCAANFKMRNNNGINKH